MLNFNVTEGGYTCPHCGNNSLHAILYTCCQTAQKEWDQLVEDASLRNHEPYIIWHKAWGEPEDAPWLSLKPWTIVTTETK